MALLCLHPSARLSLLVTQPGLPEAPGSDPQAEVATEANRQLPPPPLGWPCFHRFYPAGSGFLPSQECAPRMSILISPAL